MNRKKRFVRLLATHAMILLMPVIAIGLVMIFLYLGKLKIEFEELNAKTMENVNVRVDMIMEEVMTIYYKMSVDADVRTFLLNEFDNNQERVSLLSNIKGKITDSLVNKDGIDNVVLYSKLNDVFISNDTVYDRQEYYESFFDGSDYDYNEFVQILETVRTAPVWLETEEYLIYCSDAKMFGKSGKGKFIATIEKKVVFDILSEVCGDLETGYAVVCRNEDILMQTDNFDLEAYEICMEHGDLEYQYRNCLVKRCPSQKSGGLTYVYTIDFEKYGGNITQMIKSLILIIVIAIVASVILATRKMKSICNMYVDALEENASLESYLNHQVEVLERQLLMNALRGYDVLPFEKRQVYPKYSRIRVMIFKFLNCEKTDVDLVEEKEVKDIVKSCLDTEQTESMFLYEKRVGYICVLSYESAEKMEEIIDILQRTIVKEFDAKISVGLSAEICDVARLSDAYEWAETAYHYSVTSYEEGGLVRYEDIVELEKEKVYYPPEKEKQLVRSVRMGMTEETEKCLSYIYQMNFVERRLSKGAIRQLLVKMLNTTYELVDMAYNGEIAKYDDFGRVSRNVLQADDMEYAFGIIQSIVLSICEKCSLKKDGELRNKFILYINENFKDQDLSLEKMASEFNMSYYHLSRLFNEYMQMNFAAYLTGVRLECSKVLLCTTNLTVEQVAMRSGFQQSGSFIRAFKKYCGVTPGKYREEKREK